MSSATTKAKPAKTTVSAAPGIIEPGAMYRLDELQSRLRIKAWGLRRMRQAGLTVYRVAGRGFVLGRDVIAFVQEHGRESAD